VTAADVEPARFLALAVLLLPFVGTVVVLAAGHVREQATRGLAVGASGAGLVLAAVLAVPHLGDAAPATEVYASTTAAGPAISLAVHVDQLAAVMLLLATGIAFCVQVYSLGYLHDDPRYPSYAALVSLFTGAMSTVVLADDLWLLLVGWEVMGACSYFLIAHHWEQEPARAGAVKAFLLTRTADLGLLFAVLWLGQREDSYRVGAVLTGGPLGTAATPVALLLLLAALGKSAQVPFHTWLPDAMPGPTPISALIHAATMVAAGVYLVARTEPLLAASGAALDVLAVVASVTMLLAAAYALVTLDLKRVLAWSTVSQLAYMFGALAVGAWSAAVLHLLAHGVFKALLFLGAGSVIHATGTQSLRELGGLRERLPDTFATMTVGFGALAGVVPLVGFFSKDAVVHGAWEAAVHPGPGETVWVAWLLLVAMVVTSAVTVAYSLRAWLLTFFGAADPGRADGAHEPPPAMVAPLYALAGLTCLGGLVVVRPSLLLGPEAGDEGFSWPAALATTGLVVAVAAVVLLLWPGRLARLGTESERHPVDVAYDRGVARPVRRLARLVVAGDRDVLDESASGSARLTGRAAGLLRLAQNGDGQRYALMAVVGAVALAVAAGVLT
jgi:NADH-quinone oxidoreductase subunit L